jgi:8-oxo-dGTP diphosphatase
VGGKVEKVGREKMITSVFTDGFLIKDGKVLIIKRNIDAPTYPGRWDVPGGKLQEESAEDCMIREAKEELGIDVKILKSGKVFEIFDEYGRQIGIPFILESDSKEIKLSFEHTEYKWINPKKLRNYRCAPDIIEAAKVLGLI